MIRLEIPLEPKPWAVTTYTQKWVYDKRRDHKHDVILLFKAQYKGKTITSPVKLTFEFNMPIPKAASKAQKKAMIEKTLHHVKLPDVTNLQKLMEDTLQAAGILHNDSQVVECHSSKYYSENPRTIITIEELI